MITFHANLFCITNLLANAIPIRPHSIWNIQELGITGSS